MSLDNFAKSNQIGSCSKSIYPFEKFYSPDELIDCVEFPKYEDFRSSLSKMQDTEYIQQLILIANRWLKNKKWTNER